MVRWIYRRHDVDIDDAVGRQFLDLIIFDLLKAESTIVGLNERSHLIVRIFNLTKTVQLHLGVFIAGYSIVKNIIL